MRQEDVFMHRKIGASNHEIPVPHSHEMPANQPHWITVKDIFWALYLYPGVWISRKSLPCLTWIFRVAEPVFQFLTLPQKKNLIGSLAIAFGPSTPFSMLKAVARRIIANAVRQKADDLLLLRGDVPVQCHSFRGREHLDAALSRGKGVLLVSLHWFANRASNRYLATLGYPVMSVRNQKPPDMRMGRLGQRSLQPKYIDLLHEVIRDEIFIQDPECSLKILRRLRSGRIVEIQLDVPYSRHLIIRSFLGGPRPFPAGPLHLARTSGCEVLPKLAIGHTDSLEIQIGHPLAMDPRLPMETFYESHLSAMLQILESQALEHPDQWELWIKL
jgi:lauroyl/myristoyl acyltransferase